MDWKQLIEKGKPRITTINVDMDYVDADGRPVVEPYDVVWLSNGEWLGIEAEIPEPPVPRTLAGPGGTKQPNRDDVVYRQQLAAALNERAFRRLALAFMKADTGKQSSVEEWVAAVKQIDARVSNTLMMKLADHALNGKATVEAAAGTFRSE